MGTFACGMSLHIDGRFNKATEGPREAPDASNLSPED